MNERTHETAQPRPAQPPAAPDPGVRWSEDDAAQPTGGLAIKTHLRAGDEEIKFELKG